MEIKEIWWEHLTNPSGFLEQISHSVLNGESVVVMYEKELPWKEYFMQSIIEKIEMYSPEMKTGHIHSIENACEPDGYFLDNYCPDNERSNYWQFDHHSAAQFLAHSSKATLNTSNVIIEFSPQSNFRQWIAFAEEYSTQFQDDEQHGVFLMFVPASDIGDVSHIQCVSYDTSVHDFDILMLCMTMLVSLKCAIPQKQYIAEIAVALANGNTEVAGGLAQYQGTLTTNTLRIARKVFQENNVSCDGIEQTVRKALWKAQVKILFPIIEQFRSEFISVHAAQVGKQLSKDGNKVGDTKVDNIYDLEIGQLYYLCNGHRSILTKGELNFLKILHDARNKLAHLDVVPQAEWETIIAQFHF